MRVLHLVKTAVGAKWALSQMRELIALGVEVHVALPQGPMLEQYIQADIKVHHMQPGVSLHPTRLLQRCRQLRRLVTMIQPDLIHSHFVTSSLLMRLALRDMPIPRVFQVPGPLHLEHPLFRRLELISANQHDHWLASCQWTRNCYRQEGIDERRLGLAYYGTQPALFADDSGSTPKLKQTLGMTEKDLLIGMVAYFYAPKRYLGQTRGLKGHEDLIDALVLIRRRYPTARCVFVGGPWAGADNYFDKVRAYARQKVGGAAIFLGTRTDIGALYRQIDLAVHPSHSENVGGAVESLLARVPTVTTNVGGFPDLILNGQTGWLCQPRDAPSLAEKIIQAWQQPAQRVHIVEQGYARASELMDVRRNASDVNQFYRQILSQVQEGRRL
ncbi:glycosyltransferase family 4 protein [Bowmanella dokdonensis]|uniref:Glycosyltransferase family 4 protein n=1 Tax=Bowmanella dokdonensis TaxID=751969 RepID=A0A939DNL0_9ALTE|nr:glycosyltransferase family 4 protein [Bowmanella dokdonensis]MBN7825081.1 glycosyltransferase family 4 protein [Bowmanella dokdonensis]